MPHRSSFMKAKWCQDSLPRLNQVNDGDGVNLFRANCNIKGVHLHNSGKQYNEITTGRFINASSINGNNFCT